MDNVKVFSVCAVVMALTVSIALGKPFGYDNTDSFNRPSFLGDVYQDWRNGYVKRFGEGGDGLGSRPARWVDWSRIIGSYNKRNFGGDFGRFGVQPSFGRYMWNFEDEDFKKRNE